MRLFSLESSVLEKFWGLNNCRNAACLILLRTGAYFAQNPNLFQILDFITFDEDDKFLGSQIFNIYPFKNHYQKTINSLATIFQNSHSAYLSELVAESTVCYDNPNTILRFA